MNPYRILLSLSLLTAATLAFTAPHRAANDSPQLTIMTFNIRYGTANDGEDHWEKRKEMVFDLLRRHSPDIVGVQEALRFQLDEIRAALPEYAVVGVGRDDGKTAGEYSAILFRTDRLASLEEETFWFSDTPEIPGSMTWGNLFPRLCTWTKLVEKNTGSTFYIYNLHLDHVSQPSRERSVVALAGKIRSRKNPDPVIVTGDFNAGEQNDAIRFLKGDGSTSLSVPENERIRLLDTYRMIHPDETIVGTFHAFKGNIDGDKIDFVFVEPETHVLDAAILHDNINGRYPSDHFPVMAKILLMPRAE
ncbi:MAG: endonuclease/exonuclease/phosphatase family protein [Bacteroidetes bacterium]|nr:endonuclease/exonuclease/phosphatase family protein [Bacteroidota bacterium]MCW5894380.1 endonuclease/exonuclease/phosphatase family protein [Bacteroidota bacterium]